MGCRTIALSDYWVYNYQSIGLCYSASVKWRPGVKVLSIGWEMTCPIIGIIKDRKNIIILSFQYRPTIPHGAVPDNYIYPMEQYQTTIYTPWSSTRQLYIPHGAVPDNYPMEHTAREQNGIYANSCSLIISRRRRRPGDRRYCNAPRPSVRPSVRHV